MADGGVSLVVGAGGPTGGPFIWAALAELEERTGWVAASATEIIGTSAGAFVAATFDAQLEPALGAIDALISLANDDQFAAGPASKVAGALRRVAAFVLAKIAPMDRDFADYRTAPAPFHPGASAVTVARGGSRVQHRLRDAADPEAVVRASAAIPFVNRPVDVDGRPHVDGAVHSATNSDLVTNPTVAVVIAPMIPATGGTIVGRFHRAQLRSELDSLRRRNVPAVVVVPSESAHADRKNREPFVVEGAAAVARL